MAKLTDRQKIFCREYIVDLNATQAAIRSGYSKKTAGVVAWEILKKPYIQEEIQRLMDKRAKKIEISATDVLESILEVRGRCMQKVPVMRYDKVSKEYVQETEIVKHEDGSVTEEGVWKFDAGNSLKANELLGKHLKIFTEKKEIEITEVPADKEYIETRIQELLNK